MTPLRTLVAAGLVAASLAGTVAVRATEAADDPAIRSLMLAMFDKPDARLEVGPVVVVDDRAVAGWTQGEMGGRALLRRNADGSWTMVLCAGDGLKAAATLEQAGLAAAQAEALASAVAEAEGAADPQRVALFSRFEGVVMMDEQGHHPEPHGTHGAGHGS